ncbi:MAG: type 4b pilus protein PilO2 [Alphaproteobacteria bacterium]|nr:type 4b pilus protein PilO2 [Alphaproteobacteria bacterium]
MIKQVITVNRKKYAAGLFWQPVAVGNAVNIYANQLEKNTKVKYTLYVEYKAMVGLATPHEGLRVGIPSIAAEIMNSLSEFVSFLGVFRAGNNFYLLAVRNGMIIRDILLETENEARKAYVDLSAMPDWSALFAPSEWGMPRSQERDLSKLVVGVVGAKLQQVNVFKTLIPSAVIVLGFLLAVFLISKLSDLHKITPPKTPELSPEAIAEYQRQIEIKNKELDEQFKIDKKQQQQKQERFYPYNKLPYVMDKAKLCYKAIGFVMQPVLGWVPNAVECNQDNVSATFRREYGTINDFYAVGGELMPGAQVEQLSNNEVRVLVKLPELRTHKSIDSRDQATVMRDLISKYQKYGMTAEIKPGTEIIKKGVEKDTINVIQINASSKLIPQEYMLMFDGFQGVYLRAVDWSNNSRTWKYNISIYTK